jgi:hypothetical protein
MKLEALLFCSKVTELDGDCRGTTFITLMITFGANRETLYLLDSI